MRFPGPIGTARVDLLDGVGGAVDLMSSRALNRCWWNGAPRPGAISEAYG